MSTAKKGIAALLLIVGGCATANHHPASPSVGTMEHTLRLFDPAIFGQPAGEPVRLLMPCEGTGVEPITIMVDIKDGHYYAATVRYETDITLQQARDCLNRIYRKYELPSFSDCNTMGLWRNEDDEYVIQLTRDEEALQVIYIAFHVPPCLENPAEHDPPWKDAPWCKPQTPTTKPCAPHVNEM